MQTIKSALVILAGGLGTRFGGDKQIAPFGQQGHFLFEYACYDAMCAGFEKVFVITRKEMKALLEQQLSSWMHPNRFQVLIQEQDRPKPWGTAHALHFLKDHWQDPFLILNADDYYGSTICQRAMELLNKGINTAALVFELGPTLSVNGPVARGICNIENEILLEIEEVLQIQRKGELIFDELKRSYKSNQPVSMNAWLLPGTFLEKLEQKVLAFLSNNIEDPKAEIYLPRVINEFISDEQMLVSTMSISSGWFGITYAQDLESAQMQIEELEKTIYPTIFPQWI